ncbi:MAG: recombinase family protein [Planctomycetota bacterium]|jgi:site-specific DNA recombinase
MSRVKTPILAVAYLRKSTNEERTEKSIKDQRSRIGKLKPPEDGASYKILKWYDKDRGIPGWKRGAKRPDYHRLVEELAETGAKAILVDDFDRFSRADPGEVIHDIQKLRELGVRFLHSANEGSRDLMGGPEVWVVIAAEAMKGYGFSMGLSRRIANARKDAAQKGKRSGGPAPYGLKDDGRGGLLFGDPKEIRIVKLIFDWFVERKKSMNWIAWELNRKKVPTPKGGAKWYTAVVKGILKRKAYAGTFAYNQKKSGQFHVVNGDKEVVPVARYEDVDRKTWQETDEGLFAQKGVYKALIPPKLFDGAQKRLKSFEGKGGRRPRKDGYPLSGIVICGECDKPMYGSAPPGRGYRVYRCSTPSNSGTCGCYEIREELILPFVLQALGEELKDLEKLLSAPPDSLAVPNKMEAEQRAEALREKDELAKQIKLNTRRMMDEPDKRKRRVMDEVLSEMHNRLEQVESELTEDTPQKGYSREQARALHEWWTDFEKRAVSVPVDGKQVGVVASFYQDPESEEAAVLLDARIVNEALHELGCRVELWWSTRKITLTSGKRQKRYTFERGRLRLGQNIDVLFRSLPPSAGFNASTRSR